MIEVTRLNGKRFVVNAEQIRTVEENPDTVITMVNGDHFVVRETLKDVVAKVIEYGRHLRVLIPRT
ncbi:MAG: flagellar FlbD family protein [Phycisphaeraceae bacterium]|nr:flagellar FlbD family protein [Phycisphaeraceae bacterium]MCW5762608.1 flagellar FlbD family protein [Phycisphaeraceae bacterium]